MSAGRTLRNVSGDLTPNGSFQNSPPLFPALPGERMVSAGLFAFRFYLVEMY